MNTTHLAQRAKDQLIQRILGRKAVASQANKDISRLPSTDADLHPKIPEAYTRFDQLSGYQKILVPKAAAQRFGLTNPFFWVHEGLADATTRIHGRECLNFSSYNYLGLNGHPAVSQAAKDAIDRYGTSVSASRLVAGERPIQRELEMALAENYGVEDCIVFVSGHATNVSTISCLFGPKDLVVHDSLIHNSVLEGIKLSGASRRSFAHNDTNALDTLLTDIRGQFERVLIVVEGHYSMDGDIPDLPQLIAIKRRHKAFLMVDEAHALGVLGESGRGLHEHFHIHGREVDIWMGTLSKSLVSCGGYIAGERALVEHLKYAAPGFVYSVGIAPALAAAALAALRVMEQEKERVEQLRKNTQFFLHEAKAKKLATGHSEGFSIVPLMTGNSLKAANLSSALLENGINAQPILYPAVEEKSARIRFFISSSHTTEQLAKAAQLLEKIAR